SANRNVLVYAAMLGGREFAVNTVHSGRSPALCVSLPGSTIAAPDDPDAPDRQRTGDQGVARPDRSPKSTGSQGEEQAVRLAEAPGERQLAVSGPTEATPFLDRVSELAALEGAFERASAGCGALVLIGGEG